MVQYRYAKNTDEKTVDAKSLRGIEHSGPYHCLGCGNELIAKVNGEIQRPHFAHKSRVECSQETYLHRAAKLLFYETYKKCIEEDEPFIIKIKHTKRCRRFEGVIGESCFIDTSSKEYNLVDYYQEINLEKKDGEFIPDVMLYSTSNPDNKIYVEIAVTHFMSEGKQNSGHKVIEIPISSEDDFSVISSKIITEKNAMFIGFVSATEAVTSAECECADKEYHGFFVMDTGACFLKNMTLSDLVSFRARNKGVVHSLLAPSTFSKNRTVSEFYNEGGGVFYESVLWAAENGLRVKNCFVCRYSGISYDRVAGRPVYCKYLKKAVKSNEAASCNAYRMDLSGKR